MPTIMKMKKYFIIALMASLMTGALSSCSDNDSKGEAPRLFRPVASLETNTNTIKAKWDNISGATSYNLTLYRLTGTDETGENTYEPCATATCEKSPYTFTDLAWDEKYHVEIYCEGNGKSSGSYTTSDVSVAYASSLKTVKTIDNAARITWDLTGVTIKAIVARPTEGGEAVVKTVSSASYEAGGVDITGLTASTKYTFSAYSDSENFNNSTYAGKLNGTTTKPVDFDLEYGAGMWIDIRDYDEKQAVDTLKTADFWEKVQEGYTIILRGDFDYKVNNSQPFTKSVRFVTGPTLGGNARFISSGGLTLKKGVDVEFIEFLNVDFYSDKAISTNPVIPVSEGGKTDKSFGGRQVFNINGVACTLKNLTFKGCYIEGYRAMVRAQADGDNINNITIDNCYINGVGDQGVLTTNNKKGDWKTINITNTTFTNIVMLCDFRSSANALTLNIGNCTFCYAPMETTANANTPMFRFGSNAVTLNIDKTLFGPSMLTEGGAGSAIHPYEAGTNGSIYLNGPNALVSVSKSFKTNFTWTPIGADGTTYPVDGLNELSMDETKLWNAPASGEFKIIGQIGEEGVGDPRWF